MLRFEPNKLAFNLEQFLTTRGKVTVEVKMQFINYYWHKIMDITNYLHPSEGDKLDGHALNSTMPRASQASILCAAREMNNPEELEKVKKKRQVLPVKIKEKKRFIPL